MTPDGRILGDRSGRPARRPAVLRYDAAQGSLDCVRVDPPRVQGGTDRFISIAVSPDGAWFAAGSERGKLLLARDVASAAEQPIRIQRPGANTDLQSLAFLDDGRLLSLSGDGGEEAVLNVWRGADTAPLEGVPLGNLRSPTLVAALPGGRALVGRQGGWVEEVDLTSSPLGSVPSRAARRLRFVTPRLRRRGPGRCGAS